VVVDEIPAAVEAGKLSTETVRESFRRLFRVGMGTVDCCRTHTPRPMCALIAPRISRHAVHMIHKSKPRPAWCKRSPLVRR
jgi:hypothetical protein